MKSTEELEVYFQTLVCPKKNKPVKLERYKNDWLVQVILDGDMFCNVYYTYPPVRSEGMNTFQASSIDEAWNVALNQAYNKFQQKHSGECQ